MVYRMTATRAEFATPLIAPPKVSALEGDGGMTSRVTTAAERALGALKSAIQEYPDAPANRKAAEAIVALRKHFRHEGLPDWAGRSPEYRDMIERLYRDAGVPSDSGNNFQANLRYHLGNVVRQVAPPEDLANLGLAVEGPLGRVRQARKDRPAQPRARRTAVTMADPVSLAEAALGLVSAVKTMDLTDADPGLEACLRQVIDASLDVIQDIRV